MTNADQVLDALGDRTRRAVFTRVQRGARSVRMLRKLTTGHSVDADDMRALRAAGVSRDQIEDALAVSFAFNTTAHLADAFRFSVPGSEAFAAGAKYLLARGYR